MIRLKESQKICVSSPKVAYELMKKILSKRDKIDKDRENAWIISLSNANKIISIELISMGTCNETIINPREVFCTSLRKRACKIIIVHNHPSGNVFPSLPDIYITDRLVRAGSRLIGIKVIDHLIIHRDRYFSFSNYGLI